MSTGKIFRRGVPVGPDVDSLMRMFDLKVGDRISHEQIERVIRERNGSHRYHTVTASWRRRLYRDKNIELKPDGGSGFAVLSDAQKVSERKGDLNKITRATHRVVIRTDSIDVSQFSEDEKKNYNLLRRVGIMANDAMRQSMKEIAGPSIPPPLPRLRAVGDDKN